MGVLGLYSYFQSKSLGQRKQWTGSSFSSQSNASQVHLGQIADQENPSSPPSPPQPLHQKRYFILDGNAYIHNLYCGQFEWIWGGQYTSFVQLLRAHVQALQSCGFHLEFLFDGPLPQKKLQTRLARDTEKIHRIAKVMRELDHYSMLAAAAETASMTSPQDKDSISYSEEPILYGVGGGTGNRSSSQFLIPPLVMEVTLQTLRSLGVDLMVCDGEADGMVAQLAMEKSMDPEVSEAYAVSRDSDYFIYNTGPTGKGGYIPLDSLTVLQDPSTHQVSISATVYSQEMVADHLGILPEFLPLFASLTGNDYMRPDVFEEQIARSLAGMTGRLPQKHSLGGSSVNHARIRSTAGFLKQLSTSSAFLSTTVSHGSESKEDLKSKEVQLSLQHQQTSLSAKLTNMVDIILEERKMLYKSETEERRKELRFELEVSMEQYRPRFSESALSSESPTSSPSPSTSSVMDTPTPSSSGLWNDTSSTSHGAMAGWTRMKDAFRSGQFSFKLMDVVYSKVFWCTPFLEDIDRESAWLSSRELRRWIYGILARNLMIQDTLVNQDSEIWGENHNSSMLDIVEYVRRGDHLSAEVVRGASCHELDEILGKSSGEKQKKRTSAMDVEAATSMDETSESSISESDQYVEFMDDQSRTSLFLRILGSDTPRVRGLSKQWVVLAATLRFMINALAHSKTRSASVAMANFEVIAFVAAAMFLQEKYQQSSITDTSLTISLQDSLDQEKQKQPQQRAGADIPIPTMATAPVPTMGFQLDEVPPTTRRSLHLSTQYQHTLATVSLLANALHLEDMVPPLWTIFDGLLFQQALALARGGTCLEQRMQRTSSVETFHQILAAIEEGFIDSGEIDVAVVFRPYSSINGKKANSKYQQQQSYGRRGKLGIFGPDMEPVNQLPLNTSTGSLSTSSSSSSLSSLGGVSRAFKSSGIQKKSSSSKKKNSNSSSSSGGSNNGKNGNRGSGGSKGSGGNMFNVLSLGCEF